MTRISEAQTRKRFIDQRLKAAGWPLTSATNPQSQDPAGYALLLDGQIVAVIEAKKRTLGPQNVHTQAQRDTNGLPQPAALRKLPHRDLSPPPAVRTGTW
jgi:type I restriction enzyme R subunit